MTSWDSISIEMNHKLWCMASLKGTPASYPDVRNCLTFGGCHAPFI
jgi:hypothetical protein